MSGGDLCTIISSLVLTSTATGSLGVSTYCTVQCTTAISHSHIIYITSPQERRPLPRQGKVSSQFNYNLDWLILMKLARVFE